MTKKSQKSQGEVIVTPPEISTKKTVKTLESQNLSKSEEFRSRSYFFTLNNPTVDEHDLIRGFESLKCTKYMFQLEKGDTGTTHWQGVVCFGVQICESSLNNICRGRWENVRNVRCAQVYCSKDATRVKGPFCKGFEAPRQLKCITDLRPWQQTLRDECLEEPDDRTINWLYDEHGNLGKTQFGRYMAIKHKALYFDGGSCHDIKNGICDLLKDNPDYDVRIVIMNICRSKEGYISYQALETIKDAIFFSGKYKGGMCMYNPPHIYVLANFKPDFDAISMDRWRMLCVIDNNIVRVTPDEIFESELELLNDIPSRNRS